MQVGDLVSNYYKEVGIIIEEWESEGFYYDEKQYYVLYSDGKMEVTSEYDLEVVCK
jgi:hypothetical protein